MSYREDFHADLVRGYPKANKKLEVLVGAYNMRSDCRDFVGHSLY